MLYVYLTIQFAGLFPPNTIQFSLTEIQFPLTEIQYPLSEIQFTIYRKSISSY